MKQVQVFKKTLLSIAVVSALGGYGTYVQANQQQTLFSPFTFLDGIEDEIAAQLKVLEDKVDALKGGTKNSRNVGLKAEFKVLKAVSDAADNDINKLQQKLKDAEAALNEPNDSKGIAKTPADKAAEQKAVNDCKDKTKTAEADAKEARKNLLSFAEREKDVLGLQDAFSQQTVNATNTKKSGGDNSLKPQVVRKEKDSEPGQKVDFAAARKLLEGVSVEAEKTGVGSLPVQAEGEDDVAYQKKVKEALDRLNKVTPEDFKKMFLVKDPNAKDPATAADVAPQVIRLKGYDLRNPDLYEAFMYRIQKDVPELFEATGVTTDVVFTENTVELDHFKTSAKAPLPGAHFATPKGAKAGDPYGTYVIADGSDVYQESVGKEKPVDTFIIEGSSFHAEGEVNAYRVEIKDAENVAGYKLDNNNVTETYLPIVARNYEDTAVRAASNNPNQPGEVTERRRTVAGLQGVKAGMVTVKGYQDVEIVSSNIKSDGLGVPVAKGSAGTQKMNIKDSVINMTSGEINAESLVIEGTSKIQSRVANPSQPSASGAQNAQAGSAQETVGLTTLRGTNGAKTFIVTTNENGVPSTKEEQEAAVDTFKIGKGAEVWANVEDFEEGTVDGTLISDHIGSSAARINKLALGDGANVRRYSTDGNTIYGSEKLDLTVGHGVTVIHDVDGFHTIVLDGGLLEGNLTGLNASAQSAGGANAFEGSSIDLKSGSYQGGNVTNVKSFTISGPVHLKPGSTRLSKLNDDGSVQVTDTQPINITGNITVKSGVIPEISKPEDLADNVSPVNVKGNVTLDKGAGLAVVVDLDRTDETVLKTAYLNIEDGTAEQVGNGTLSLQGGNKVHIRLPQTGGTLSYDRVKALYDNAKEGSVNTYDLTVVNYQHLENSFEAPVSDTPILTVSAIEPQTSESGASSYGVSMRYNTDLKGALRTLEGMSRNDAEVGDAAFVSSMEVGGSTGAEMFNLMTRQGFQKTASENQWDPNPGMAVAAVTVTQKANQSISRHLNRHRTGIATGDMFESQGFWGEYIFSDGEMDNKDGVRGYKNKVNGINLGLDALLNDQLTVGFAFTYGDLKTETNDSGPEATGDTFMGTFYTGWTMNNYFFDTMWSYARGDLDLKRRTSQGTYKTDTKSDTLGVRLVGGYNYQYNQWLIQPQVEFNYVKFKLDDFKEKLDHGPFAQSVKFDDFEVMELGAGLKLMADYDVSNGLLKPEFTLMGYHDFKDKEQKVQGTFLNGGISYHVTGADRKENRVLAGVGVKYEMNNNLTLGLNYDYNWQDDYTAHGVVASVRYNF